MKFPEIVTYSARLTVLPLQLAHRKELVVIWRDCPTTEDGQCLCLSREPGTTLTARLQHSRHKNLDYEARDRASSWPLLFPSKNLASLWPVDWQWASKTGSPITQLILAALESEKGAGGESRTYRGENAPEQRGKSSYKNIMIVTYRRKVLANYPFQFLISPQIGGGWTNLFQWPRYLEYFIIKYFNGRYMSL